MLLIYGPTELQGAYYLPNLIPTSIFEMSRAEVGHGERWDRERFERARGPPVVERERYFEERDRYAGGAERRMREGSDDEVYYRVGSGRQAAPARYEEKDRYYIDEKFARPNRPRGGPGRYYDEEGEDIEGSPSRGQMVPFETRRQSITERFVPPPPSLRRGPPRPNFIRRQSSLDTFDRKPMPRYGDRMREPPEVIAIPSRPRRRSPPRMVERDYEEVRRTEQEYYPEEEFRGYKEREISTVRRRRADSEAREIFEEEETVEQEFPKRGKTRMPMRLVNKRAVIELGYPFEEEVRPRISHLAIHNLINCCTGRDTYNPESSWQGTHR